MKIGGITLCLAKLGIVGVEARWTQVSSSEVMKGGDMKISSA